MKRMIEPEELAHVEQAIAFQGVDRTSVNNLIMVIFPVWRGFSRAGVLKCAPALLEALGARGSISLRAA